MRKINDIPLEVFKQKHNYVGVCVVSRKNVKVKVCCQASDDYYVQYIKIHVFDYDDFINKMY